MTTDDGEHVSHFQASAECACCNFGEPRKGELDLIAAYAAGWMAAHDRAPLYHALCAKHSHAVIDALRYCAQGTKCQCVTALQLATFAGGTMPRPH